MNKSVYQNLLASIEAANERYFRLILLVGEHGSGKTRVLQHLAEESDFDLINLNLELSRQLLDVLPRRRPMHVQRSIDDIVSDSQVIVILDNIEILFDTDLKQDPLRLLQGLSRNRTVVASWSGTYSGVRLVHAEPDHPEYRVYDAVDALIVNMNGTATIEKGL